MEFYRCCLFVTFVVLTVDQFVGRDNNNNNFVAAPNRRFDALELHRGSDITFLP